MRSAFTMVIATALLCAAPASAKSEAGDTAMLLADLIRVDTTNPPGDTRPVAMRLKRLFDAAGIPNETIVAPNGRTAHFIARLSGDGSQRPVLLAAHTDVVPADRRRWSVDPFGGLVKGGLLYGRGALDNKGAVAAFAQAVLRLKRENIKLARDVIFLAEADEEQGSYNTNWLAAEHWDKIDAEYILNEGGTIRWDGTQVREVMVTYADKITVNVRLHAEGPAGHSSRPLRDGVSANDRLVRALSRLASFHEPIVLTTETRRMLEELAKRHPIELRAPVGKLLEARSDRDLSLAADGVIAAGDFLTGWGMEGLLRNTLTLTIIQSGLKPNIIPGVAEATLNARLMPGADLDGFLRRVREAIADEGIAVSVLEGEGRAAQIRERARIAPSSLRTDLFEAIRKAAAARWPRAAVLPTLFVASTDATPWRARGLPVYGIAPFPTTAAEGASIHGDDERVSLKAIEQGADFVYDVVLEAARRR